MFEIKMEMCYKVVMSVVLGVKVMCRNQDKYQDHIVCVVLPF